MTRDVVARRPGPTVTPFAGRRLRASSLTALVAVLAALLLAAPALGKEAPKGGSGPVAVDTTPLPDAVTDGAGGSGRPASVSATGAIAKMVAGLAIVLAVIYGVYWLLKSAGRSKRKGVTADGRMAVIGTTVLAPGRSLHLVKVGDDLVLVGAAEHAVTRVHAWTGEEARRLDVALSPSVDGLGSSAAGARLMDELRRRTLRG